jgi:hypothetical protein
VVCFLSSLHLWNHVYNLSISIDTLLNTNTFKHAGDLI